ncbi:MAG: ATP-binding cassette domain-containing protein [Roseburia sp.]|uniref:ATP-binding cassette domain-containing protein n=1 Tax=Roseburia sp. 831b TaxID=1261635 RepID=UPI000951949A|nr:ATP-binding cassette domain-containing protein [Roseburia sp. 831b]MCI5919497.1 ATP-binding cassette domain-containing protein [Roseburia sp.]MDD6217607.1 ATP-binding cassette domain-containing protein [Roseburia sp.]MDY5882998.1 ATP-binding cassette domain-containing protein [Roseburia sp.]WVK73565.1 ATP-binding cassette domain-containing protein [Roseburia sp. 831b]
MYLELKQVSKKIKNNMILDHISLELEKGNIYGLQGKNGSGKTMLIKAMCGLLIPTEGSVTVNGAVLGKDRDFPESVGALIENPGFVNGYSAFQNLKVLAEIQHKIEDEKIYETIKEVGLEDAGEKKFRQFSLGMKQKLGIAAAIMEEPDLILLDEPTNALDEKSVLALRDILKKRKERGALIVIASHDAEELSLLADEIFRVENGKITGRFQPTKEKAE